MSGISDFPQWAIDRASAIARMEGVALLRSAQSDGDPLLEHRLFELTVAIATALVQARDPAAQVFRGTPTSEA